MQRDWIGLGKAIVARRRSLGFTAAGLATAMSQSPRTVGDLENGRRASYRVSTLRALENALAWKAGSVEQILAGGDPLGTVAHADDADERSRLIARLAGDGDPGESPSHRVEIVLHGGNLVELCNRTTGASVTCELTPVWPPGVGQARRAEDASDLVDMLAEVTAAARGRGTTLTVRYGNNT